MTSQQFQILSGRASLALFLGLTLSCGNPTQTSSSQPATTQAGGGESETAPVALKKMPAGKQFSGFLADYSNLKPNPNIDGDALTFAKADERKNLHKYIAVIVDPVQVYIASDADESKLPEKARGTAARYFHKALVGAVSSAFPIVDQPGPLVLRLRSAIVGVDVGRAIPAEEKSSDGDALDNTVNIGKVGVEMELVDSETGEQIAAMVDRESLGTAAEIGSANFSRQQKSAAAYQAFDGWARRVRTFLNTSEALSEDDAKRADQAYRPYSEAPVKK
jgi:Protein of unknown function (DUF3313)